MVTPAEVPSGRACACTCPGCGIPLLAKKGEQIVWHFAHDGQPCTGGTETAIHLMAKQIIMQERTILLPAVEVSLSATDAFGRVRTVTGSLAKPREKRYSIIELEATRENRRPDAVGIDDEGQEHYIEVFVRHAVDAAKIQDMEERGCMCYEICLNDISAQTSIEQLRAAVVAAPERVRWISYPGMPALRVTLAAKLEKILDAFDRKKKADENLIARAYAEQVRAAPGQNWAWNRRERERSRQDDRVERANQSFRSASESSKRSYLKAKLRIPEGEIPHLIDHPVRCDDSFGVPRDVWQADVFRKHIFAEGRQQISLATILAWLARRYELAPTSPDGPKVALWNYFKFLESAGIVRHRGKQYFDVLTDIAPWLDPAAGISGTWFWLHGASTCPLATLLTASDTTGHKLGTGVLMAIRARVLAEHQSHGAPDAAARTVAQKFDLRGDVILSILSAAGVAACSKPQARTDVHHVQAPRP
jgi:hypothetical protein